MKDIALFNWRCLIVRASVFLTILVLIFGRLETFVWLLGFFALGLESTLPLPQFFRLVTLLFDYSVSFVCSNYKQKSLYGFRASTLVGWVGGDFFKCGHVSIRDRLSSLK